MTADHDPPYALLCDARARDPDVQELRLKIGRHPVWRHAINKTLHLSRRNVGDRIKYAQGR